MNRFGWTLLLLFALLIGGFLALSRFGGGSVSPPTAPAAQPRAQEGAGSGTGALVVPVAGVRPEALHDTFGEARGGGTRAHGALDILAPRGTPVLAAAGGTVEKLFDSKDGGRTLYVRSPDGRWVFYYAHLDACAPGIAEGVYVPRGARIATVGATGNADPSAPHLHFEVKRMAPGEPWHGGRAVDPYPLLAGSGAGS